SLKTGDGGVSVQGHLLLHNKAIYMPAGNKPTIASYAVADGKFAPAGQGRGRHLYVRNNQARGTGLPLYWRPDDEHLLTPMELETPSGVISIQTNRIAKQTPKADPKEKPVWAASPFHEIAAIAAGKNALLVTGVNRDKKGAVTYAGICAVNLEDGSTLWKETLPANPVAWGLALDRKGRIVVTLTNGRVVALERK